MAFHHKHPAWQLMLVAIVLALSFFIAHGVTREDAAGVGQLPLHYKFPPSFGTNRQFFAGTLALMMVTSTLCFGALIENIRFLLTNGSAWREPAKVTVFNETMLLLSVLLGVVPDVLVLLTWGEIMAPPYALLSKLDRALDGVSALAFLMYIFRRLRARPVLLFQLQRGSIPIDIEPSWQQLRPKLGVVLVVILISFGVAFAK